MVVTWDLVGFQLVYYFADVFSGEEFDTIEGPWVCHLCYGFIRWGREGVVRSGYITCLQVWYAST